MLGVGLVEGTTSLACARSVGFNGHCSAVGVLCPNREGVWCEIHCVVMCVHMHLEGLVCYGEVVVKLCRTLCEPRPDQMGRCMNCSFFS